MLTSQLMLLSVGATMRHMDKEKHMEQTTLEQRIAALEQIAAEYETKRKATRNQLIALQMVVIRLLPLISAISSDQLDAAIEAAKREAETALLIAGFAAPDRADVLESMDVLRDDLLGAESMPSMASWH